MRPSRGIRDSGRVGRIPSRAWSALTASTLMASWGCSVGPTATAGITEPIIFRHFPSKQALYTAVLDSKLESCGHEEWLAAIKRSVN